MLTDRPNFIALHLRWCVGVIVALGIACGWYYVAARASTRWPGGSSVTGFVFGIVAAVIILFEFAIWLRKSKRLRTSRRLGTAQLWMKAHIWLGLLVAPLAWMHAGFEFGGLFSSLLMWMLLVVVGSGIFGLVMQNLVPRWMLEHVQGETIFSQIDLVKRQYANDAARVVLLSCGKAVPESELESQADPIPATHLVGAPRRVGTVLAKSPGGNVESPSPANSNVLWQAYEQVLRPYLDGQKQKNAPSVLASRRTSLEYFAALRVTGGDEIQQALNSLEQLCDKTRDLNLQQRLHYFLHGWLVVHLPLSISLVILLAIHILYALRIG